MGFGPDLIAVGENLKLHFPFRIVWIALGPNDTTKQGADFDRRKINRLIRKGWLVAEIK
jgi:hypothetical protein